ncbi:hypothetical protein [Aestuariivivens sediminis]|uniref:hypothetical protein n=1 Tax=Aestuariivivens sediminis TaxID=2913557 RepID=UPI001F582187|nr:hypothetical protein [Aestuariivivens sediminis]
MIAVLRDYIKIRIHLIPLIGLTILMTILILSVNDTLGMWLYSMGFLFSSFIVFRIVDDIFSAETDIKKHPERTYLVPARFKLFKKVTVLIVGLYLLTIYLVFPAAFLIILLLLAGSVVLYLLFRRHLFLLKIIPLLKYPVLLFCVSITSSYRGEPEVFLASFLLMAGFDSFDLVKRHSNHIWKPMILFLGCSLLLFKPWEGYVNSLLSLAPLLFIYGARDKNFTPYITMVYFPVLYVILTHL